MKILEGITVVDFTRLLPGPLATLWMADMGAKIIKIEDPRQGDYAKFMGVIKNKVSLPYALLNHNKEVLIADANDPTDRERIIELIKKADVLVESFRPGQMKKWNLDFDSIKQMNPKLVYCSLTGFGQMGSKSSKAAHDINYLALTGVLDQTGPKEFPALSNFQIADIAGGSLPALCGILAGLFHSARKGIGCFVDCSIYDNLMAMNPILLSHLNHDHQPPRGMDMLSGAHPGYALYETSNHQFLALGALEQKFWNAFCEDMKKDEWIDLIKNPKDWPLLKSQLANFFLQHPLNYWVENFQQNDYCLTPVLTYAEAYQAEIDEKNSCIVEQIHPTEGKLKYFYFPLKFTQ